MLLNLITHPFGLAWSGLRVRLKRVPGFRERLVEVPGFGPLWIDKPLNFVGDNCLRTNLLTKVLLEKAPPGTLFELSSDNLSAIETIPFMLHDCGCDLLWTRIEPSCHKLYIRKSRSSLRANLAGNSDR
jgi:TusA-related sulfurtransferase